MKPDELRTLAIQCFGDRAWQTRLAEHLQVDGSTVRRWVSGAVPIPNPASVALRCLAREVARSEDRP